MGLTKARILSIKALVLLALPLLFLLESKLALADDKAQEPTFAFYKQLAHENNIEPEILLAVLMTESRRLDATGVYAKPSLYSLNVSGNAYHYKNRKEMASALAKYIESVSLRNIDIGPFQINAYWYGSKVKDLYELTDPMTNAKIGAQILGELRRTSKDLTISIGRYHSWTPHRTESYGRMVISMAERIRSYWEEQGMI